MASRQYSCRQHPYDHDSSCCPDKSIYSAKDQLYNFRWQPYGSRDTLDITSKTQFYRECKQRNLKHVVADDLLKNRKPYAPEPKRIDDKTFDKVMKEVLPATRKMRETVAHGS